MPYVCSSVTVLPACPQGQGYSRIKYTNSCREKEEIDKEARARQSGHWAGTPLPLSCNINHSAQTKLGTHFSNTNDSHELISRQTNQDPTPMDL